VFVLIGRDQGALREAVDALVKLPRGRAGVLATAD
jgi:hypothetical protein